MEARESLCGPPTEPLPFGAYPHTLHGSFSANWKLERGTRQKVFCPPRRKARQADVSSTVEVDVDDPHACAYGSAAAGAFPAILLLLAGAVRAGSAVRVRDTAAFVGEVPVVLLPGGGRIFPAESVLAG